MILVDTGVWSLALRRRPQQLPLKDHKLVQHWADLADKGLIAIVGPIRQEVLSGLRHAAQFTRLQAALDAFHFIETTVEDFDRAAEFFNTCRSHGIAGGDVDMLICSLAVAHRLPLFTIDSDFERYAQYLPLDLYVPPP